MITRHEIFNKLATDVNTTSRPVYITSRFEPVWDSFPAVYATETSHRDVKRYVNLDYTDVVKEVTWEVQVFSNKQVGAIDEAHGIMIDIETSFREMKFIETYCAETPYNDRTVYRVVARFERVIAHADTLTGGNNNGT